MTGIISTSTKTKRTVSPICPSDRVSEEFNFNVITLNDAHVRLYSMELQKRAQSGKNLGDNRPTLWNAPPPYFNAQNPYLIEITNETRKFTLAAMSHFDLEEWWRAI